MDDAITAHDKDRLMRLYDPEYHGAVEGGQPYHLTVPAGWKVSHELTPWVLVSPESADMPLQGWKIHVSAVPDTAQQALTLVSQVAFASSTPFKYLSGLAELRRMNGKYADRGSAGKFIALYPRQDLLAGLLGRLDDALKYFEGPYVLSDVRYGVSPTYVRYGGFVNICDVDADGTERLCIRGSDGGLVEDERGPSFWLPESVEVPDCLRDVVSDRLNPTDTSLDELLEGYGLIEPVHFSNGGGVYLLRRSVDGNQVIMKEGRPSTGWDPRGTDAVGRLRREAANLRLLSSTGAVPAVLDMRSAGGHLFLFEEKIEGDELHSWTAKNYPHFGSEADRGRYAASALQLIEKLEKTIMGAHSLGVAIMDIQPHNVFVTAEEEVRLIDLESACPLGDNCPEASLGTPGYVPESPYTPLERDHYALFQLCLGLFHPAAMVSVYSDAAAENVQDEIAKLFPGSVTAKLEELRRRAQPVMTRTFLANPILAAAADEPKAPQVDSSVPVAGTQEVLEGLVRGVHLVRRGTDAASPSHSRYPFSETSYSGVREISIEHGLAGVMLALGRRDRYASEDLAYLREAALRVKKTGSGLLNGILGVCLLLASRGCAQEALDIYLRHCDASNGLRGMDDGSSNLSLRSGLSGKLLGALVLNELLADDSLSSHVLELLSRAEQALKEPPARLRSPEAFTGEPLGLLDGWSGLSLAITVAAGVLDCPDLYEKAMQAIRLDSGNMEVGADGTLQAADGSRSLPYLADGSAGFALALSAVPRKYRGDYDAELAAAYKACDGTCVLPGLYHGVTGLMLVSGLLRHTTGMGAHGSESISRLLPFLMQPAGTRAILVPGEDREHLSVDFVSGAAGVIFGLRFLRACAATTSLSGPTTSWDLAGIIGRLRKGGD